MFVDGDGGLGTKSCPALVTPWTVAHQVPLSVEQRQAGMREARRQGGARRCWAEGRESKKGGRRDREGRTMRHTGK